MPHPLHGRCRWPSGFAGQLSMHRPLSRLTEAVLSPISIRIMKWLYFRFSPSTQPETLNEDANWKMPGVSKSRQVPFVSSAPSREGASLTICMASSGPQVRGHVKLSSLRCRLCLSALESLPECKTGIISFSQDHRVGIHEADKMSFRIFCRIVTIKLLVYLKTVLHFGWCRNRA